MQIYFDAPEFDSQLLRTLSYTYYQGADIGECLTTSSRIKPKDFDSWFIEWIDTAERIYKMAEASLTSGCNVSAMESFLRASNYYRTAMFFLFGTPVDQRLIDAYDKHVHSFEKAVGLFSTPVVPVSIPFEDILLNGFFYKPDASDTKRPTLIISNGYDGTHQEGYLIAAAAGIKRGYNVLCFDGPGQGHVLIKQQTYMRSDWEKVISTAINFLEARQDVDPSRIVLLGTSWGGYLAGRTAAFEHRIAALVVNPGFYHALDSFEKALPNLNDLLENDPEGAVNKFMGQVLSNTMVATKIKAKMWIHGVDSPYELLRAWKEYSLRDVAKQIQCPTLVMDSENEPLSTGQAKQFYDSLSCPKDYLLFSAKEGAGEHCEAGAISLAHTRLFDWLQQLSLKEQMK